MDRPARRRSTGIAAILVVALAACGGSKTAGPPTATTSTIVGTSTSVAPQASLSDVFGATLPPGYSFGDAPASVRTGVQQEAQTAEGATILRAADVKLIELNGKSAGYATVFLLQPGLSAQNIDALVRGYASSQAGSTLTTTMVGGRAVTMIRWSSTTRLAYAASSSKFVVIVVMQTKAQLDTITTNLISSL